MARREQVNVRKVDPALWLELRKVALEEHRTAGGCLNEAIRDWLQKERTNERTKDPFLS